jgi:glutaredoxin
MIALTIYSKPGCHLCDEMKAVAARVARSTREPVTIAEVDITTEADLERRYAHEIPVLLVNGKKAAKYRISEADLKTLVERAGATGRARGAGR